MGISLTAMKEISRYQLSLTLSYFHWGDLVESQRGERKGMRKRSNARGWGQFQ
jgi:hypothetical protein